MYGQRVLAGMIQVVGVDRVEVCVAMPVVKPFCVVRKPAGAGRRWTAD